MTSWGQGSHQRSWRRKSLFFRSGLLIEIAKGGA